MIELRDVTKSFRTKLGRHLIFEKVNLTFQEGVNTGILGPNGSGKTTLLKLISGELLPDRGKIIRNARVSWTLGFAQAFHGRLTGRENLRFISRIYGADIAKVARFVEEFTELGKFMEIPIRTYSAGMRAKLAFGLSMAIDFDWYLIDEITAVGDVAFQKKCKAAFDERRSRATLIVVSHNPLTIQRYCDNAVVIHDKRFVTFPNLPEAVAYHKQYFT